MFSYLFANFKSSIQKDILNIILGINKMTSLVDNVTTQFMSGVNKIGLDNIASLAGKISNVESFTALHQGGHRRPHRHQGGVEHRHQQGEHHPLGRTTDGATTGGYTNTDGNYIRRSHGHAFHPHDEHKYFGSLKRYYRPAYYYPWNYPTYSYPYHMPYYHDYPTYKIIQEKTAPTPQPQIIVSPPVMNNGLMWIVLIALGVIMFK